jgi:hypothetical protein
VRVLLPPVDQETALRLLADVERWRSELALRVVTEQLQSVQPSALARVLLRFQRSLIVLPAQAPVLAENAIRGVLDAAAAVLVVQG